VFLIGLVGTVFWPVSPDAAVTYYVLSKAWSPAAIGLLLAGGQGVAQGLLFAFGSRLRRRWGWFNRRCERVREKYGARLRSSVLMLGATSGLFSVPPTSITATLAPGLGLPAMRLLPVMFALRVVRFTAIAFMVRGVGHALGR